MSLLLLSILLLSLLSLLLPSQLNLLSFTKVQSLKLSHKNLVTVVVTVVTVLTVVTVVKIVTIMIVMIVVTVVAKQLCTPKHRENREKLPWELVGCQGVEVILKKIVTKLKNSNCERKKPKNSNCDKTQKLWLWQNSKTQIVSKLKNWNWDQTQKF